MCKGSIPEKWGEWKKDENRTFIRHRKTYYTSTNPKWCSLESSQLGQAKCKVWYTSNGKAAIQKKKNHDNYHEHVNANVSFHLCIDYTFWYQMPATTQWYVEYAIQEKNVLLFCTQVEFKKNCVQTRYKHTWCKTHHHAFLEFDCKSRNGSNTGNMHVNWQAHPLQYITTETTG